MNRTRFTVVTLSLLLPLAVAGQSNVQTANMSAPMTGHEVQSLIKSANSSAQYKQVADYYHQREAMYRAKAAEEKAERDRCGQVNASLMQKYPRPVDSAQYFYESYLSDANSAAIKAQHYDQLAAGAQTHNSEFATDSHGKS
jgi:hypothetical protein